MARPSKCTEERVAGIIAAIARGLTIKGAAESQGISVQTLARWRKSDAELAERVARAEAEAEIKMVRIITEAAPKDWRAAAWFLERSFHS
jgi:hypothetical protein